MSSVDKMISSLSLIEEGLAELIMDFQHDAENEGDYTSGLGEICAPEDAAPELDCARTMIQDAIEELTRFTKGPGK